MHALLRLQHFLQAFSQLRPAEEVQLTERLEARGGVNAVRNNEAALRELFKAESARLAEEKAVAQERDGTKQQHTGNRATQQSEYKFNDFVEESELS